MSDAADLADFHAAIAVLVVGIILIIAAGIAFYRTVQSNRDRLGR